MLPCFGSPVRNAGSENYRPALRPESSNLELFFDLFFIANLATFTANHSVVDRDTLVAYIGLFAILWFTWFQITIYDVRFAIDSIYERIAKVLQFVLFVGFAFVGASFNPVTKGHNNYNFRVLCWLLFVSRLLLATQHGVALRCIKPRRDLHLTFPLSIMIITFLICAGAFYAMTPAFRPSTGNGLAIYYCWYIILAIEMSVTVGVSCIWRRLSFKRTHLQERMSLLTLIVIGEGTIGVTKTVSKLMVDSGLNFADCAMVVCIVAILLIVWMLHFDNLPLTEFGSIREQVYACLHFPLHLAIVGLVEGSQQIALARKVFVGFDYISRAVMQYCTEQHLSGDELRTALSNALNTLKLENKPTSAGYVPGILDSLQSATSLSTICSVDNTASLSLSTLR